MEFFTVTKSSYSLILLLSLITHNMVHQSYEYKEVPLSNNDRGTCLSYIYLFASSRFHFPARCLYNRSISRNDLLGLGFALAQ